MRKLQRLHRVHGGRILRKKQQFRRSWHSFLRRNYGIVHRQTMRMAFAVFMVRMLRFMIAATLSFAVVGTYYRRLRHSDFARIGIVRTSAYVQPTACEGKKSGKGKNHYMFR